MKTMSTRSVGLAAGQLLDQGLVGREAAVADVRERTDASGGGVGRVLDVRVMGGIDLEVWPDRGLDIGPAWYRGTPLSWTSPVGRGTPLDVSRGTDWLGRFRGGLVTTCGTDNIGPATATSGLHGRHSSLPATDVRHSRSRDGEAVVCRVTGTIEDVSMFERRVLVHRTVETRTDSARVVLRDIVENVGWTATAVPVLYHVNLGAPLVRPGTRVRCSSARTQEMGPAPWVPDPTLLPEPVDGPEEAVFEHVQPRAGDGLGRVEVGHPDDDLAAVVQWSIASLPRFYQWVWPARRGWGLGLEPSNAVLSGPGQQSQGSAAPLLPAGCSTTTELTVSLVSTGSLVPAGPR